MGNVLVSTRDSLHEESSVFTGECNAGVTLVHSAQEASFLGETVDATVR